MAAWWWCTIEDWLKQCLNSESQLFYCNIIRILKSAYNDSSHAVNMVNSHVMDVTWEKPISSVSNWERITSNNFQDVEKSSVSVEQNISSSYESQANISHSKSKIASIAKRAVLLYGLYNWVSVISNYWCSIYSTLWRFCCGWRFCCSVVENHNLWAVMW